VELQTTTKVLQTEGHKDIANTGLTSQAVCATYRGS